MAFIEQKPWVNPFGKIVNFSTFWTSCFYSLEGCFFVLEYCKRHFAGIYCQKKKVGKWASFGPKPLVNPFVKMLIIRPFELLGTPLEKCQFLDFLNFLVLDPRKACFHSKISYKKISWPILPQKEKVEKWAFLDQNDGLTPSEKCQFFHFLNFLFL